MYQTQATTKYSLAIIRWIARVWGLASVIFVLAFIFGEGLNLFKIKPMEGIQLLLFPFGVMLGLLIAWRWEGVGGGLALFSFVTFYILHYVVSGNLPGGPFFALVAAPSLLFLLCWMLSRR